MSIFSLVISLMVAVFACVALATVVWWFSRPHLAGPSNREYTQRFQQEREKFYERILQEYGKLTLEINNFVATADPDIVKRLLTRKEYFQERSTIYWLGRYFLSGQDGILSMEGEEWKRHSRVLAPIFHSSHVEKHAPAIAKIATFHLQRWENGETPEMGVLPSRRNEYGSEQYNQPPFPRGYEVEKISSSAASGGPDLFTAVQGMVMDFLLLYGFNCSPRSSLGVALASEFYLYRKLAGSMSIPNYIRMATCTKRIQRLVSQLRIEQESMKMSDVTNTRITDGETKGSIPNFLTRMLNAGFDLQETAAEVNHLYGAYKAIGFVTTCMIWRLSKDPEWVTRLREEWNEQLSNDGRATPTREDMNQLIVTRGVVNECLRMHVVSQGVLRKLSAPLDIDGTTLPTGTEILILLHALHHHPKFWNNRSEFHPSRFFNEGPKPYTFLPFLSGGRMCAGKQLAELHLIVLLHSIFRRYDVKTATDNLILEPDNYSTIEGSIPFTLRKCGDYQ